MTIHFWQGLQDWPSMCFLFQHKTGVVSNMGTWPMKKLKWKWIYVQQSWFQNSNRREGATHKT